MAQAENANVVESRSALRCISPHRITARGTYEHPPKMLVYRRNIRPSASDRFGSFDAKATLRFRLRQ